MKLNKNQGIALDIDETLSDTAYDFFSKCIVEYGNPEELTIEELLAKYRYSYNVPYWPTKQDAEWVKNYFESNEIQKGIPLIDNSNEHVQNLAEIVPINKYVTARPEVVENGTRNWLDKHSFPDVEIILKPMSVNPEDGNKWKAGVLVDLYPEIIGIVDDNPGLIEFLPSDYKGVVFLYNYSENYETDLNVISCENWIEVIQKAREYFD